MNAFQTIDLSQLPAPEVVETLDFERILEAMVADLRVRLPEWTTELDSDPVYKLLQVAAYRELLLRARINQASRSVMLAYAEGEDLDHLAALFRVPRLVINVGDPLAVPPRQPEWESDEDFRQRIPMSLEGYSTAGPAGAYRFYALSADARVKDVDVHSPEPGHVVVTVVAHDNEGEPDAALLSRVAERLQNDNVRPLTDKVTVQSPPFIPYAITAVITPLPGPDASLVLKAAQAELERTVASLRIGASVSRSALLAALHQEGVATVDLIEPASDVVGLPGYLAVNQSLDISLGEAHR